MKNACFESLDKLNKFLSKEYNYDYENKSCSIKSLYNAKL